MSRGRAKSASERASERFKSAERMERCGETVSKTKELKKRQGAKRGLYVPAPVFERLSFQRVGSE